MPETSKKIGRSHVGRALLIRGRLWIAGRVVGASAAFLLGCPLYEDDCDSRRDCASGFRCDRLSRRCSPIAEEVGCRRPDQCGAGETCTPDFACRPGSCQFHGCVTGYSCGVVDSVHTCVLASTSDAGDPVLATDAAGVDGPSPAGFTDAGGFGGSDASADAGDASADASL